MGFDDFKADRLANLKDGIAENEALLDEKVQLFNELLDHFL